MMMLNTHFQNVQEQHTMYKDRSFASVWAENLEQVILGKGNLFCVCFALKLCEEVIFLLDKNVGSLLSVEGDRQDLVQVSWWLEYLFVAQSCHFRNMLKNYLEILWDQGVFSSTFRDSNSVDLDSDPSTWIVEKALQVPFQGR